MLGEILVKSRQIADTDNVEVILGLLDYIDRLEISSCSYAFYIGKYVSYKLLFSYLSKDLDKGYMIHPNPEVNRRIQQSSDIMKYNHSMMYQNICGCCSACQSRRKAWPDNVWIENKLAS